MSEPLQDGSCKSHEEPSGKLTTSPSRVFDITEVVSPSAFPCLLSDIGSGYQLGRGHGGD